MKATRRLLTWPAAFLAVLLHRAPPLASCSATRHTVPLVALAVQGRFTLHELGAAQGQAGATTFVQTPGNPIRGIVGTPLQAVFTYVGTPVSPQSFRITGSLPPGLSFAAPGLSGDLVNAGIPAIEGIPAAAGTFSISVQGFSDRSGGGHTNGIRQEIRFEISENAAATAPGFSSHPQTQSVNAGLPASFFVAVTGSPSPTLQWRKDGGPIPGATGTALFLTDTTQADSGVYTVVATNSAGAATSEPAVLTVIVGSAGTTPFVAAHPAPLALNAGDRLVWTVVATGSEPLAYQWRRNSVILPGATGPQLMLPRVLAADAGEYTVRVTNSAGGVTSVGAALTVGENLARRLANLSVRARLDPAQTLIVGFSTTGLRHTLLRGVGPSLAGFGVGTDFLPDPRLEVYSATGVVEAANDNWPATLATTAANVGAFPLIPGSADAALVLPLEGTRSAHLKGLGAGVALVEAYDLNDAGSARLVNLSARNHVGTGDNVLIVGFVTTGPAASTLLVRGAGPALTALEVPNVLQNPRLEIISSTGLKVAENDDWPPALAAAFAEAGAFPFVPGSQDAALVVTLPPGLYTARLSGVADLTGEALVEVYELR